MIKHIKGDIFKSGADVIIHQVNCHGVMGGGIALQVRQKYPEVYKKYVNVCKKYDADTLLGMMQTAKANDGTVIVNMFSQNDFGHDGCYTDYDAMRNGLETVRALYEGKSIAIPYLIGCGLGGGDWKIVSQIIEEVFADREVTLYEYNGG